MYVTLQYYQYNHMYSNMKVYECRAHTTEARTVLMHLLAWLLKLGTTLKSVFHTSYD